ncbi:MAG: hypothetical protein KatS3mg110_1375 [Pirellulaceae bacterium]|nr:MAG: hypothetical protein KatS3mg110_1375 [Pirellulaceae bacterium]
MQRAVAAPAEGTVARNRYSWLFPTWLLLFYSGWLSLVVAGNLWHLLAGHWPIAVAMMLGSFVAGSTPMGGGTIGFPVLVLLLGEAPSLGRDFSFAIQSIGMTSASIYILSTRKPIAADMLLAACTGSAIGTPLGILFLAPQIPGPLITVLFAVVWASFGILTLRYIRQLTARTHLRQGYRRLNWCLGGAVGFLGGMLVASVTGVGVDMLLYCVLVLVRQADLRVAVPTSVILMAFTSLVGVTTLKVTGQMPAGVFPHWLAAAPIVAVGAPFGAWVAGRLDRRRLLGWVAFICLLQFVFTYWQRWDDLGVSGLLLGLLGLALFQWLFRFLGWLGRQLPELPGETGSAA